MRHSLQPPRLGDMLRRLREARRVSRETLAFASGVSTSYLTHLERGDRERPTRSVILALLRSLDQVSSLTDAESRHCFDLAGVRLTAVPSVTELRETITADTREGLTLGEPRLASYFDARLNLLACNAAYATAFDGLTEGDNYLRWYLNDPRAQQIMVDWDDTLARIVGWLRGVAGGLGCEDEFTELLSDLAESPEFHQAWINTDPIYSDTPNSLRMRDVSTGERYDIDVQEFRMDSTRFPGWIWYFQSTPPRRGVDT